jgi:cytidine deaminase
MTKISDEELIEKAKSLVKPRKIKNGGTIGSVGCALITDIDNIYLGASIDTSCGIGFCAEHSAIAAMVTRGEQIIKKIVAVVENGSPIPPCGRCRELMNQLHEENINTEVILGRKETVKLSVLLPRPWDAKA